MNDFFMWVFSNLIEPFFQSSIKGLTMAGLNVVSVTDVTPITFGRMPRPKKLRKL